MAAGTGLPADCTGVSDGGRDDGTASPTDASYTVSMAPVGETEFNAVPENVPVYGLLYADMAVALGHGDAVNSLGFDAQAGGNTLDACYQRLDGVSFDRGDLTQLDSGSGDIRVDAGLLYEPDGDLHLADPCLFRSQGAFYPSNSTAAGFANAHVRPLGTTDDCFRSVEKPERFSPFRPAKNTCRTDVLGCTRWPTMAGEEPAGDAVDGAGAGTGAEATAATAATDATGGGMRARTWSVAANFRTPADYDIPPLPEWTVYRRGGTLALGAGSGDGNDVFIVAENPVDIRR